MASVCRHWAWAALAYERSQVLFDVDIAAPRHAAIAVLGRNGAGKTTLMKTIVGELPARRGHITVEGRDATRLPTERRVRLGLGYVPQEHGVFGRLSVRENLEVGAAATGDRKAIDEVLTIFPKLGQRLRQPAATLSGGERKMLAIGRALLARPKLLLLDEPTEGVWIGVIGEIAERVRELVRHMSIVLVEQHLEFALDVASYAYVLDRGCVALESPSASVRSDARLLSTSPPDVASMPPTGTLELPCCYPGHITTVRPDSASRRGAGMVQPPPSG